MRDTIKGVMIGALVAAGVTVLLAQTPSWTAPRTWATDDLLTASQFNAQFRDNLLNIRGFAACAESGISGTSSALTVLYGDCRWEAAANYVLANTAVGPANLRTATLHQSGNAGFLMPGGGYAFWPVATITLTPNDLRACFLGTDQVAGNLVGAWRWKLQGTSSQCHGDISSVIRYMTASDDPSIWVVLDAAGIVTSMWEAEDQPDGTPLGADPGQTVTNVGLPTLAVVEALYADTLTETQRSAALNCTGDYVTGRRWRPAFVALSDLSAIETRYEPSGRQWAMRCAAAAVGQSVGTFYTDNLVVSSGAWAVAP